MSDIAEVTLEQIKEALKQKELGKSAWQGFIQNGAKIGFQYLLDQICEETKNWLKKPGDYHRNKIRIAIALITGKPKDINEARSCLKPSNLLQFYPENKEDAESWIDLAGFTYQWADVEEVRKAIDSNCFQNNYYLAKARLVLATATGNIELVESVLKDVAKINDPYLRVKVIIAISKTRLSSEEKEIRELEWMSKTFRNAEEALRSERNLMINALSLRWYRGYNDIKMVRDNARRQKIISPAILFSVIAAATKEVEDLEVAYESARNEWRYEYWPVMARILAGID